MTVTVNYEVIQVSDDGGYPGYHLASNATLIGDGANDFIDGRLADHIVLVDAGGGNDTVIGADADRHTISGGAGDDVIRPVHFAFWAGESKFDGGAGSDTLDLSMSPDYYGDHGGVIANLTLGTAAIIYPGFGAGNASTIVNFENLIGSGFSDNLTGNAQANRIAGGLGDDTISGAGGDDVLVGGAGNDVMDGGSGNDLLDYRELDGIAIQLDVKSGAVVKMRDGVRVGSDSFRNVERFIGTDHDDLLKGATGNQFLDGAAGNDILDGGAGNDTLSGGVGDDLVNQSSLTSSDTIDGGEGEDTLDYSQIVLNRSASIVLDLQAGKVVKTLNGKVVGTDHIANFEHIIGVNRYVGSTGNDLMNGSVGDDVMRGLGGNDSMSGQNGNDRFVQDSLKGNDTLNGGNGSDAVDYSENHGTGEYIVANLNAGTVTKYKDTVVLGTDKLQSVEAVTGTDGDDHLSSGNFELSTSLVLNGGAGGDSLYGAAGDDTLIGDAGNDFMYGAQGYNHFMQDHWDDSDFLLAGSSSNVADYSGLVLEANMTASADPHIVANLGINRIEKFVNGAALGRDAVGSVNDVTGSSFNDVLNGNAQANALFGGAGNDVLVGAAGDDSLAGGSGNDTLDAGTGNDGMRLDGGGDDVFIFKAGFGTDVISVSNTADIVGHATVQFEHIAADNVLFQRLGDDLQITIAGTTDNVSISNWYGLMSATGPSSDFAIDAFQAGDAVLDAATVAHLVTVVGAAPVAMSSLSGEIVFPMPFETASPVLF